MTEGEQGMSGPEQRLVMGPEQNIESPQEAFNRSIRGLIEPRVVKNEQGEDLVVPAIVEKIELVELARRAMSYAGKTPEGLTKLINIGNDLCDQGTLTEESGEWAQWMELVLKLEEHRGFLTTKQPGERTSISPSISTETPERKEMKELFRLQIEEMMRANEISIQAYNLLIDRITRPRLSPEDEQERWVDVEWQQEFYARFTPNIEPGFYTSLSSEEREEWEVRWRLARAAYWKKIYSANTEKLVENQDLIDLSSEDMELLYNIEGVKEGLEWYTRAILGRIEIEGKADDGKEITLRKSLVECESGKELKEFRVNLQHYLKRNVFGVTREMEAAMNEQERQQLRIRIKGADAIAWNWIFVSNLVESVDSRYDFWKERSLEEREESGFLRERHGSLASAICSDDLRAVFHPLEKFESKAQGDQARGAFGRWGVLQMNRIRNAQSQRSAEFIFMGASSPSEFWKHRDWKGRVLVSVPECYPVTTMQSFWETYGEEGERESLLSKLINGERINWNRVQKDPWKTNYQTVVLNKANQLNAYFAGEAPLEEVKITEWTRPLMDIFVRLKLRSEHGGRLSEKQHHNLKVWAVYASRGGVKNPNLRRATAPFENDQDRSAFQSLFRNFDTGLLRKHPILGTFAGEELNIT